MMHKLHQVLVVDRHAALQLLVQHHLERNGYIVNISDSWSEAVSLIRSRTIQCVIGSYNTEEFGCLALENKIFEEQTNSNIPFIYYSTFDTEHIKLPNPEIDAYLQMPFSIDRFTQTIQDSLLRIEQLENSNMK